MPCKYAIGRNPVNHLILITDNTVTLGSLIRRVTFSLPVFKALLPPHLQDKTRLLLTTISQELTLLSSKTRTHRKEGAAVLMENRPGNRFSLTLFLFATITPP